MDRALLETLQAADDPRHCEWPADFDLKQELAKVRELVPVVERLTGRRFKVDENVQDASFFTDLATYEDVGEVATGRMVRIIVLGVRFSAFGRLFTMLADNASSAISPSVMEAVVAAVRERGYTYVDQTALHETYTGPNPYLQGVTWWIRFFDYL